MPADSPTLPTKYTVFNNRGVTRGSSRPTVYFTDGSRFTRIHRKEDKIGYHKPPHKYLLFINIHESEMNSRKKGTFIETLCKCTRTQKFERQDPVKGFDFSNVKKIQMEES